MRLAARHAHSSLCVSPRSAALLCVAPWRRGQALLDWNSDFHSDGVACIPQSVYGQRGADHGMDRK
eukprot:1863690-Prymnesium_polylepis.1